MSVQQNTIYVYHVYARRALALAQAGTIAASEAVLRGNPGGHRFVRTFAFHHNYTTKHSLSSELLLSFFQYGDWNRLTTSLEPLNNFTMAMGLAFYHIHRVWNR